MQKTWGKVTRWAGIGNNGSDAQDGSRDEMVEEMKDGVATAEGAVERVEAGMEEHGAVADRAQLEAAQAEVAQLKDRLARLQAEFENARKRDARERADAREYTVGSTVEPFLGVMDNFRLALQSEGSAEQLRSGVELILKQMEEALKGLNVTPVETVGTMFDPRIHEALGSIETAEFPDHEVVEEIRRGYKIRERLLRPAMVKIAVNKAVVRD